MADPKISIIVPVYNAEKWLPELFSSLSAQTYRNWEAILVDDASTDASGAVCRRQVESDSRFRYLPVEHGGLSWARNNGIEAATGDYIFFIDADDCIVPDALSRLLQVIRDTDSDIAIGESYRGVVFHPMHAQGECRVINPEEAISTSLYQNPPLNAAWGKLYRREIFLPEGPRFRGGIQYEDLDLHTELFEKADRIAYLTTPLYFYRQTPGSILNTFSGSRLDVLDVTDRIYARYRGTDLEGAAAARRFSAYYNILLLLLKNKSHAKALGLDADKLTRECFKVVKQGRRRALKDPKVRLKNKLGAILSYGGLPLLNIFA